MAYHVVVRGGGTVAGTMSFTVTVTVTVTVTGPAPPPESPAHRHGGDIDPLTAALLGASLLVLVLLAVQFVRTRSGRHDPR